MKPFFVDKIIKTRSIKFIPLIGIGYWKDDYKNTMPDGGYCHHIVLPFIKISFGELYFVFENKENIPPTK